MAWDATFADEPGLSLFAYPLVTSASFPLSEYLTHRVATSEPKAGLYTVTLDDDIALYGIFAGNSVPSGADTARHYLSLTGTFATDAILGRTLTSQQLAAMVAILGIPASGTTPETPSSGVLASIKTKTDPITPGQVYAITRITRTGSIVDVEQFEHETTLPEPFDTTIDYSATALECVWERESDNTEIAKIDNAAFTKTALTLAINEIPVAVRSTVRTLKYSIRVVTGERVIQTGNWIVSRAPRDRS